MRNRVAVVLILISVIATSILVWNLKPTIETPNPINAGAKPVQFTAQELEKFQIIRDRVYIYNTDSNFTGTRLLEWISMRNSSSHDYYQKSMEYLCFWSGQGANGEWEAVVSIYNAPNSTSDYVVEVSRFTWHSIEVRLDGKIMTTFPQVTNDTTSIGYVTFHVKL
jgi:hypothetical protein